MTPQQIVGLAARLCAVWLALTALSYFFSVFGIAQSTQDFQAIGGKNALLTQYLGMAAVYLGGALLLWFFPMTIAHKLIPRTKFQDTLRLPNQQVVAVACVVLGLVIVVLRALPLLSVYLPRVVYWITTGEQLLTIMPASQHISGFDGFIQLAAGLYLIVKANTLAARLVPSLDAPAPQARPEPESTACADDAGE